jgi:hypothetical protein
LPTAGAFKGALDFSFTLEVLFQLPLVLRVTLRQRFKQLVVLFSLLSQALLAFDGLALFDLKLSAWVDHLDRDQALHSPRQVFVPSVEVQQSLVDEALGSLLART